MAHCYYFYIKNQGDKDKNITEDKAEEKEETGKIKKSSSKTSAKDNSSDKQKTTSNLPKPKKLSWINVTSVDDKQIKGTLKRVTEKQRDTYTGKKVTYKARTIAYKKTLSDLKK